MSSFSSLTRGMVAVAVVVAGTASAQAPANDTCAGAEVLTLNGGTPVTSTTATRIDLTAAALESPFLCFITSTKNSIWYAFTPTTSGTYIIDTCGAVTNYDTIIQLYSGTCAGLTALGTSSTGCNDTGNCGSLASTLTFALTAGTTYYVQVAAYTSVVLSPTLTTALTVRQVVPPANDRCDGTIPVLSIDSPVAFETNSLTTNDSQVGGAIDGGAGSCYLGLGNSTTASINAAPGRDVVFSFTPPATGAYSVRLQSSSSVNSIVYLTDSCVTAITPPQVYAPPQCIAAVNRYTSSSSIPEDLTCIPLTAGVQRFIWADEGAQSTSGSSYELEVNACTLEAEPNDTTATASPRACPVTGSAGTTTDVDFFALGTNPTGARAFAMIDGQASANNGTGSTDYDLRVTTDTDTLEVDISDSDTLFGTSAGSVAGTPLPAVPSYLRVNYTSASAREPYRLYSVVQTGTPVPETEPNDTTGAASGAASNYFSGDVTSTTDIDLYAFEARKGDLVYLALDSQPSRQGSSLDGGVPPTGNHTLQLLDPTGLALVAVNDSNTAINNTLTTGTLTAATPVVPSEALVYRIRANGTYQARVGRTSSSGTGAYLLSIAIGCSPGGGIGAPTLSSISPNTGTVTGGTSVTLTGTDFSTLATVRIGGALATITSRSATSITVNTPAGNEGAVDVTVTNPGAQTSTLTGGFTYFAPVAPPTVTSVTPATGPTAGGTVITVNGTLFKAGAEVTLTVGGVPQPATNVTVVNSTQLQATTPPHAKGLATVTVRNPVDALEGSADLFTYLAPPSVSSITPNTGVTSGGQTITLQGDDFRPGAVVRFGATAGTAVTVDVSGTSLTVVTPSATLAGAVNVTVINTDTQQTVVTGGFTYVYPAPTITTVAPNQGAIAGGTTITITGTGFQLAPTVTVGGAPATSVNRVSLTQVTAVTPPGISGPADVTLTNSDSQSVTLVNGFTYQGPPIITSIVPATGLTTGGLTVTILGSALRPGAVVRFGSTAGTSVVVDASETSLTVTTPAALLAGPVDVTVVNVDTQQAVVAGGFTYTYPAPTITAVSPSSGFASGGTTITITGTGFQLRPTVTVGGAPATNVNRTSLTSLTATTPAGTPGLADVVVTNSDAQSATLTGGFRYVPAPVVSSVAPNHGPVEGGTLVTLTGNDFLPGATVRIGGVPAFAVNVTSPTSATAVTNANVAGAADVELTNPDTQSHTLPMGYTYDGAPTLTGLSPTSGSTAGGTVVTLTGSGFLAGASVLFGSDAATNVTVVSPTELTAVTAAHPVDVVSVTVRNADGQSALLAAAYRFVAPPSVASLTPDTGDVAGGTVVHITGAGFNAGTTVSFGGTAATQVALNSPTELDAVTPAHMPGVVDVVVSASGASATLTGAFTYTRSAPTLTAVAPASGPTAGGTLLTLTGTGFAPGATISVGGSAATDVVIVSSVLARAVAPAHAAGAVDVVLTNDDAQLATLMNGFTYVAPLSNETGTVTDGGSGALGSDATGGGGGGAGGAGGSTGAGGVSCGCSSFDGSMFSMAGFGLMLVLSRRRRSR